MGGYPLSLIPPTIFIFQREDIRDHVEHSFILLNTLKNYMSLLTKSTERNIAPTPHDRIALESDGQTTPDAKYIGIRELL